MKIVYYEMRKSWLKPSVLLVLIALSVLNIYRLNEVFNIFGRFSGDDMTEIKSAYYQMYDELNGSVSANEIQFLKENDNRLSTLALNKEYSTEYDPDCYTGYEFGDFALFHFYLVPEVEYYITYPNLSNKIVSKAYENIDFYTQCGNSYQTKYNTLIYNLYSGRNIPEYHLTEWAEHYFSYDFSSLLAIIMLIAGLSSCFSQEKECGMSALISSSGKVGITVRAKLASAFMYSLLLALYFVLLDLATVGILYGVDGLDRPVYSAEYFAYCPYSFTFAQAILICAALKFIALFIIAELIMLISEISPNTIVAAIVAFAAAVALILTAGYSDIPLNPIMALTPDTYLKELNCINLFGEPVPALCVALFSLGVISVGLAVFITIIAPYHLRRTRC